MTNDHRQPALVGRYQPRGVMARHVAGNAAGVGVPVPGNAVGVPLLETGHEPNITSDGGLAPSGPGDHAVDDNVDGEAKPLVAITGDHLGGVGHQKREPVGR